VIEGGVSKRRAIAARLLACLVPVALCMTTTANAAAERPVPPILTGTNPPSSAEAPASSLTPSVLGESEPVIIKESAPLGVRQALILTALQPTKNPNFIIEIFSGEECIGPAIGRATAGAFDAEGIPVAVSPDVKSTFSAWQVNPESPSEPSFCSGPRFYWEGNVPPESGQGAGGGGSGGGSAGGASSSGGVGPSTPVSPVKPQAPRIHTNPGGVANNTAPFVVGSAQGAESVVVYAGEGCKGTSLAKGSASQLAAGIQVSVTPNASTTFSATPDALISGLRS